MLRFRLNRPRALLSVSADGQRWFLDECCYDLLAAPIVVWQWGLVVPLANNNQRRWLWLWWFQLSAAQLAQLRCLALIAAARHESRRRCGGK